MDINNLEVVNQLASKLTAGHIKNLSEDEILSMVMERPDHPGHYGFMLQLPYFKSQAHLAEIMLALMERMRKVENLKEKMEDIKKESGTQAKKEKIELIDYAMMLECRIKNKENTGSWKIEGWDTFSSENYPLEGVYKDEETAREAARLRLIDLEKSQPTKSSGGQEGIQDRVFVIGPDGSGYRFREL